MRKYMSLFNAKMRTHDRVTRNAVIVKYGHHDYRYFDNENDAHAQPGGEIVARRGHIQGQGTIGWIDYDESDISNE